MLPIRDIAATATIAEQDLSGMSPETTEALTSGEAGDYLRQHSYRDLLLEIGSSIDDDREISDESLELLRVGFGFTLSEMSNVETGELEEFPDVAELRVARNYIALRSVEQALQVLEDEGVLGSSEEIVSRAIRDDRVLAQMCDDLMAVPGHNSVTSEAIQLLRIGNIALQELRDLRADFSNFQEALALQVGQHIAGLDEIHPDIEDTYDIIDIAYDEEEGIVTFRIETTLEVTPGDVEYIRQIVSVESDGTINIWDSINSSLVKADWDEDYEYQRFRMYDSDGGTWHDSSEVRINYLEDRLRHFLAIRLVGSEQDGYETDHYIYHRDTERFVLMDPIYETVEREEFLHDRYLAEYSEATPDPHDLGFFIELAKEVRASSDG